MQYRIVLPVNTKAGIHREIYSYPCVEGGSLAYMRNVAKFWKAQGAYVEVYIPDLELWMEVSEEEIGNGLRIPAPTN